ncbi:ROK family protein [Dysgonomonas reticulitermitis]
MAVIGIDLGGTKITGAVFDNNGNMLHKVSSLLEHKQGSEVGILVKSTIDNLVALHSITDIQSVGICVPGIANSKTGKIWAPNIKGWDDYPLQEEIRNHINNPSIKVDIASDRTCYILGETWKGAAVGCSNALFIAVGTGIGIGILVDGKILHGHGDIVGAAGWLALETPYLDEYEMCGCFESQASGNGIAWQAKKIIKGDTLFKESILYNKDIETIIAQDIFAAYGQKDPLAKFVLGKAIRMWGMAAANLVSLLNPEKIIWGGGVFGPASQFIDNIYEEACKWAQPVSIGQVRFEQSHLSGDAGLYGAGYLAILSLK